MSESPQQEGGASDAARVLVIAYKNYRGERATRHVLPLRVWFGSTDWHPETQWFLEAYDLDRGAERSFAMRDIEQCAPEAGLDVSNRQAVARSA